MIVTLVAITRIYWSIYGEFICPLSPRGNCIIIFISSQLKPPLSYNVLSLAKELLSKRALYIY